MPDEMHTDRQHHRRRSVHQRRSGALATVFKHIDKMQAARLKPPSREFADFFTPVALAGLVFGGLHLLALFGMRYTPW